MKQTNDEFFEADANICPNCKHDIKKHSKQELAECTIEFLKSGINN